MECGRSQALLGSCGAVPGSLLPRPRPHSRLSRRRHITVIAAVKCRVPSSSSPFPPSTQGPGGLDGLASNISQKGTSESSQASETLRKFGSAVQSGDAQNSASPQPLTSAAEIPEWWRKAQREAESIERRLQEQFDTWNSDPRNIDMSAPEQVQLGVREQMGAAVGDKGPALGSAMAEKGQALAEKGPALGSAMKAQPDATLPDSGNMGAALADKGQSLAEAPRKLGAALAEKGQSLANAPGKLGSQLVEKFQQPPAPVTPNAQLAEKAPQQPPPVDPGQLASKLVEQGPPSAPAAEPHFGSHAIEKTLDTVVGSTEQTRGMRSTVESAIGSTKQTGEGLKNAVEGAIGSAEQSAQQSAQQLKEVLESAKAAGLSADQLREMVENAKAAGNPAEQHSDSILKRALSTFNLDGGFANSLSDQLKQIPEAVQKGTTGVADFAAGQTPLDLQEFAKAQNLPEFAKQGIPEAVTSASLKMNAALAGKGITNYNWSTLAAIATAVGVLIVFSTPRRKETFNPDALPPINYNVDEVNAYWRWRPLAVAKRASVVASEVLKWALGLLLDNMSGLVQRNAPKRAEQLRKALERLGPTYVKVAQALSTRVDLLEPEYLTEIERLQDRVAPFPNDLAEATMERSFGKATSQIFEKLSKEPVAAASLGQVYRGTLRKQYGGGEVAVKVQRPGVLVSVALDLYLMRWIAIILDNIFKTTWTGIIDEWAGRFFHELDYSREARNGVIFKEQMSKLDGITVPDVYPELCTKEVLTTAWVNGEKLSESNASDVRELANTLLNCYLIQLLETGFLHADPHPGNLLRTPGGKICILDFGLMTEISPERAIALVEYIAHLTTEDYASIPGDLYKLGFIPEGAPDPATSGLVEPLGKILKQLSQGGGAKSFNIDEVIVEMEELTEKYPFQIPSYFALILRAFSVIEGIALRVDPDYAIVQECFPYLARRLLTDNSPRVRAALQQMLYGEKQRLDIGRLKRLASGYGSYTTAGLEDRSLVLTDAVDRPILDDTTKEALKTLFRPEGSVIQEVFVAESVAAVDAIGRELASQVSKGVLGSGPAMTTLSFVEALGPLRPFVLPLMTPLELLSRFAPSLAPTKEDQEALSAARTLVGILQTQPGSRGPTDSTSLRTAVQLAQELQPLLPDILPGIAVTGELFVRALTRRVAMRIAAEAEKHPRGKSELALQEPPPPASQSPASFWLQDAVASSPLWLVLPQGPPGFPQGSYLNVNRNDSCAAALLPAPVDTKFKATS